MGRSGWREERGDCEEYNPVDDAIAREPAAGPAVVAYSFLFRWLHWLLVPSTLV